MTGLSAHTIPTERDGMMPDGNDYPLTRSAPKQLMQHSCNTSVASLLLSINS